MISNARRGWIASLATLAAVSCTTGDGGTNPLPEDCETQGPTLLEPGEAIEFDGSAAGVICVGASSGTEEFVLVGVYGNDRPDTITVTATAENTLASGISPSAPSPPAAAGSSGEAHADLGGIGTIGASSDSGAPRPDHDFHRSLRLAENELFAEARLPMTPGGPLGPAGAAASVPDVGDLVSLNAQPNDPCGDELLVTGRVRTVSERAIVIADVDNPSNGFTTFDYQDFAEIFDELIVPVSEDYFGTPSDIDANGRTILFFTKEVNALGADEDGVFTAGFFFARDLLPRSGSGQTCPTSNEAEVLYLLVPDPTGEFGSSRSRDDVEGLTRSTIIHELQHLINASTRLFQTGAPSEALWLNEGLSHIAEEALFYRSAGLEPRSNISTTTLGIGSRAAAFNRYQVFNFSRFILGYLEEHEVQSPFDTGDAFTISTRGAIWSFLRYVSDRVGGDDAAFFRGIVQSVPIGFSDLGGAVGGIDVLMDWLADWAVAVYADDRVEGLASRHRDASWDHFDIWFRGLQGPPPDPNEYITPVRPLDAGIPVVHELTSGGVAYYRFGVGAGQTGEISLLAGGGAPSASFRAILLRTR